MKAIWQGEVLAESNDTIVVEGNHYFPTDSINTEFFVDSDTKTTCPWKGEASYADIIVDGKKNADAAWYYPNPKPKAEKIKGHYAFWKGVKVTD